MQLTFSAIAGMHGFFFLGLAIAQIFDLDLRPLGNLALLCAVIQILEMAIIAGWGLTTNFLLIELALGSYVLILLSFWAATHGRISTRPVGVFCIVPYPKVGDTQADLLDDPRDIVAKCHGNVPKF